MLEHKHVCNVLQMEQSCIEVKVNRDSIGGGVTIEGNKGVEMNVNNGIGVSVCFHFNCSLWVT